MSFKAVAWTLLAAMALTGILLVNYWGSYQPLSTLVYFGIVMALAGLANLIVPFRFLGVRKRWIGALVLVGSVGLAAAALFWPASTTRVAERRTRLDDVLPEYQFNERHSVRVHARREQVMQAIRDATFNDMTSLIPLLRLREAVLRAPAHVGEFQDKRILDSFLKSGFLPGGSDHEILMLSVIDVHAQRRAEVHTLEEAADYRKQGAVKMGYNFVVEDAGEGWSKVIAETRVLALDDTSRGMARYWRVIVPGSGLLRLQWLNGIKRRAESMQNRQS